MPKVIFGASPTSLTLRIKLLDSTQSDGRGITGLSFSATGLTISTIKSNEASATYYTAAGNTIESIATLGTYAAPSTNKCRFREVNATYHKGVYELQFADARTLSADSLLVSIAGATNLAESDFEIQCKNLAADLKAIDGELTNDNNATLYLKKLDIENSTGMAVSIGGSTHGVYISGGVCAATGIGVAIYGAGAGEGMVIEGGDTGHALKLLGGATEGDALNCTTPTEGHGIYVVGAGAQSGIHVKSSATGGNAAILAEGQGDQSGIVAWGGDGVTGGRGVYIKARSGNSDGLKIEGFGNGEGADIEGGLTGNGLQLTGGATSGDGLRCNAQTLGHGIVAVGAGIQYDAIRATGGTDGAGLRLIGTGAGSKGIHATGYDGMIVIGSGGSGLGVQGATAGLFCSGSETGIRAVGNLQGIHAFGQGETTGVGMKIEGGESGADALQILGIGTGNAVTITGGVSGGDGLNITGDTGIYVTGYANCAIECIGGTNAVSLIGSSTGLYAYGTSGPGVNLASCNSSDIKFTNSSIDLDFDGTPFATIMANILAMSAGKFKKDFPTPGDVTFYAQDGSTVLYTMHITTTERTKIFP